MTVHQHQSAHLHGDSFLAIVISVFLVILLAFLLLPVVQRNGNKTRQAQCTVNLRQMMVAIQMYQQDHSGKFPNRATFWQDVSLPPNCIVCPTYGGSKGIGYGYNSNIGGKTLKNTGMSQTQNLPVVADSSRPSHLLAVPTDIDYRHQGKAMVGFADGHVGIMPPGSVVLMPVRDK